MNTQGSMFTDSGFSPDCSKGTLIAFDDTLGIYIPAAAKWSTNYRTDGSVIPETSSYVLGVLISDVVDNEGTVLTNGWTKDEELIQIMTAGLSGDYYLDIAGKAKAGRSNITTLPVYCFSYRKSADSGNVGILVFNPQPPEYAGHSHGRYVLPQEWQADSVGSSLIIPNTLPVFDALTKGNSDCVALVKNGTEVAPDLWSVTLTDNECLLSVKFTVLDSDEFIIHTITPFTAEEPIVRSVAPARNCKILKTDVDSGNVKLSVNEASIEQNLFTGRGVVSLSNARIATGPVVQQLHPGSGVEISQYVDPDGVSIPGSYVLSSTELSKQEHDMLLCNLDGAVLGSTENANSYVFPKGLNTKLHGGIRVPYIPKVYDLLTGTYIHRSILAKLNVVIKGTSASAQSLNLTINKVRMPEGAAGALARNTASYLLTGNVGRDETMAYKLVAEVPVNSCDYLTCTLAASSPTSAIEVLSISLSLS